MVPGAWGLDISPDNTEILQARSSVMFIRSIRRSPSRLTDAEREYRAERYRASEAFVLAYGRLALLGAPGGLSVDGYQNFAIWNPASNALTILNSLVAAPAG